MNIVNRVTRVYSCHAHTAEKCDVTQGLETFLIATQCITALNEQLVKSIRLIYRY